MANNELTDDRNWHWNHAVAYRNENTNQEWVIISRYGQEFTRALEHFNAIKGDFPTSQIAVIAYKSNQDAITGRARYSVDNRDKSKFPIRGLSGLINSLESDWF
jgi:hypothetical protein